MNIVIHTQYYPPELGAPQARLSELAQGLVKYGHKVYILTAMPSYPQGKIYPGYKGIAKQEEIDGVKIIRSTIYATQKANLLPRLTNYFSFVFSSLLIGLLLLPKVDYLLTESPPLFLGIAGFILSRAKGARWIFNVSDLWPESAVRLGILNAKSLPCRISEILEAFCYRKAYAVTGQSKSILTDISRRFPGVRTHHFSNGVDTNLFQINEPLTPQARCLLGDKNSVIAVYAGLHGLAQGLDQILFAAEQLRHIETLKIVLIGDGPEKPSLIRQAKELGLENVCFLDPLPRSQMPAVIAAADISLVPLKTYIPGAVPSKLYEAMASAKPVLLIAEGEAAEIVSNNQCGLVVSPGDINGLVKALSELARNPSMRSQLGHAGRIAAEQNFDRGKIITRFAQFLETY